jgi:hypothetical protein
MNAATCVEKKRQIGGGKLADSAMNAAFLARNSKKRRLSGADFGVPIFHGLPPFCF